MNFSRLSWAARVKLVIGIRRERSRRLLTNFDLHTLAKPATLLFRFEFWNQGLMDQMSNAFLHQNCSGQLGEPLATPVVHAKSLMCSLLDLQNHVGKLRQPSFAGATRWSLLPQTDRIDRVYVQKLNCARHCRIPQAPHRVKNDGSTAIANKISCRCVKAYEHIIEEQAGPAGRCSRFCRLNCFWRGYRSTFWIGY